MQLEAQLVSVLPPRPRPLPEFDAVFDVDDRYVGMALALDNQMPCEPARIHPGRGDGGGDVAGAIAETAN